MVAALAPLLATHPPSQQVLTARLQPPSAAHWLGTDELGRDIYSRIIQGSRLTLYIVGLVVLLVGPVGLLVGTVAGYVGGWLDTVLMRITDVFLAFPRLILALAFVAALGPGIENAIIAIAITAWPPTPASRAPRPSPCATPTSSPPSVSRAPRGRASGAHRAAVHVVPDRAPRPWIWRASS